MTNCYTLGILGIGTIAAAAAIGGGETMVAVGAAVGLAIGGAIAGLAAILRA